MAIKWSVCKVSWSTCGS